jgi:hypothetical protein
MLKIIGANGSAQTVKRNGLVVWGITLNDGTTCWSFFEDRAQECIDTGLQNAFTHADNCTPIF